MNPLRFLLFGACAAVLGASELIAAETTVHIGAGYSPADVTIAPNDTVRWIWDGFFHSTTSGEIDSGPDGLWDSGVHNPPNQFTHAFPNAGTFPYYCSFHFFTGTVTVQSANTPPSVNLTSPQSGGVFAAPANVTFSADALDDGSVAGVEFFTNTVSVGLVASFPYSLTLSNLPAGNYSLTATATDNLGSSNTSAGVSFSVVTPLAIVLSNPLRLSGTQFKFDHTANAGLKYVIERASPLGSFAPLMTNTASGGSITVTDSTANPGLGFYRVGRLPNP